MKRNSEDAELAKAILDVIKDTSIEGMCVSFRESITNVIVGQLVTNLTKNSSIKSLYTKNSKLIILLECIIKILKSNLKKVPASINNKKILLSIIDKFGAAKVFEGYIDDTYGGKKNK